MPLTIGIDIGTTTITALALDVVSGEVVAVATARNDAEITSTDDRARGRSEWDAERVLVRAYAALRDVAERLGDRRSDLVGLSLTGQQHGGLIVDDDLRPLTPLINWQDRRALDRLPGGDHSFLAEAVARLGPDAPRRAGCPLLPGFLALTLFWLRETGDLPARGVACFVSELLGARLTGTAPVTEPTMAGSSGVLRVATREWDGDALAALGLRRSLFPLLREAGDRLGRLTADVAEATGLPADLPVFVGLGDHQASFVGSVADPARAVFVNIGTGAQVARAVADVYDAPPLETRPYPRGGNLLVHPGLAGGRIYALLERFFRQVGRDVLDASQDEPVYGAMNRLAAEVAPGADGLRCDPTFMGSRLDPARRAVWTGMTDRNFTPAHMTRALLEGMARTFRKGYDLILAQTGTPGAQLVGAGNGLRENPLLASLIADEFGLPLVTPVHREEAAYGTALVAAVGAGVFTTLREAGGVIQYRE